MSEWDRWNCRMDMDNAGLENDGRSNMDEHCPSVNVQSVNVQSFIFRPSFSSLIFSSPLLSFPAKSTPARLRLRPSFSSPVLSTLPGLTIVRHFTSSCIFQPPDWINQSVSQSVSQLISSLSPCSSALFNPSNGRAGCQLVTFCHPGPGPIYIFNFWHSSTLAGAHGGGAERHSVWMPG